MFDDVGLVNDLFIVTAVGCSALGAAIAELYSVLLDRIFSRFKNKRKDADYCKDNEKE